MNERPRTKSISDIQGPPQDEASDCQPAFRGSPFSLSTRQKCTKCNETKPFFDFYTGKKGKLQGYCKKCRLLQCKEYVSIPRVREKRKEEGRRRHLKNAYSLTSEEYQKILLGQGNCCAICGRHQDTLIGKCNVLCVDHDHKTKQIRGLLCRFCNSRLGWYEKHKTLIVNYVNPDGGFRGFGRPSSARRPKLF